MDISAAGSSSWARQKDPTSIEENEFLEWLRRNGALFHDVEWPSSETESGIRGAIATRNIDSGEYMIQIPHALMMSDFHAKADPDYGHVHRLNIRLLDSDNGLAVFIMQEILKEDKSFYRPYLRVLPSPYNLRSWSGEDLLLLQDHKLVRRVAARRRQLRALYHDTIEYLSNAYPELYSADRYTFELFDFAWSTLQARAFGKRLKSSALVPFADCLNHGNVQTKYDFDVEGNGTFRLFPCGTNFYPRRAEVLNSYGRRANDNLLLDYGFAMLDNEWETAEVVCCLSACDDRLLERRRKEFLRSSGQNAVRILRVRRDVWSTELMRFCRCACLTAPELDNLEAAVNQQAATPQGSSPADVLNRTRSGLCSARSDSKPASPDTMVATTPSAGCIQRASAESTRPEGKGQDKTTECLLAETAAYGHDPPTHGNPLVEPKQILARPDERQKRRGGGRDAREERYIGEENGGEKEREAAGGGGSVESAHEGCRFPRMALSPHNEVAALTKAMDCFVQARDAFPTTLEHDETAYREARLAQDSPPELLHALIYRVTIKRILARQLGMAEEAVARVQALVRERSESFVNNGGKDEQRSTLHAPPSSSRLDDLLSLPPHQKTTTPCGGGSQYHHHSESSGSTSFASYLLDVERALLSRGQQKQQGSPSP